MAEPEIQREEQARDPIRRTHRNFSARIRVVAPAFFLLTAVILFAFGVARAASRSRPSGFRAQAHASHGGGAQSGAMHAGHPHMHQHLPQWIREHGNLPISEQERALRAQPGFDRLPARKQQRLIHRLQQLDAMPPARRERTLQRMEAMERLSPGQRRDVRHTMRDIMRMPTDQRQKMHRAFRHLAQLPPDQRQAELNSPQFRSEFSDRQRQMLQTLMTVQPYNPSAQQPATGAVAGGK